MDFIQNGIARDTPSSRFPQSDKLANKAELTVNFYRHGNLSYLIADGFFNDSELRAVKSEVDAIRPRALEPSHTLTAMRDGAPLKRGRGLFLDSLYEGRRDQSHILTLTGKIFTPEFAKGVAQFDASFGHISQSTNDVTLLNYYEDGDSYSSHQDESILTAVWFLGHGDYAGGELLFTQHEIAVEPLENRVVIFHGCVNHEVLPVRTSEGSYRASIAKGLNYR